MTRLEPSENRPRTVRLPPANRSGTVGEPPPNRRKPQALGEGMPRAMPPVDHLAHEQAAAATTSRCSRRRRWRVIGTSMDAARQEEPTA